MTERRLREGGYKERRERERERERDRERERKVSERGIEGVTETAEIFRGKRG